MKEELGARFFDAASKEYQLIGEDELEFPGATMAPAWIWQTGALRATPAMPAIKQWITNPAVCVFFIKLFLAHMRFLSAASLLQLIIGTSGRQSS